MVTRLEASTPAPGPWASEGKIRAQWLWLGAIVPTLALSTPALAQEFPRIEGEHRVVVTVDDLPIPSRKIHPTDTEREKITRELLAVLRKHGIQAVAFVVGRNVGGPADERLLDLWLEAGHELGSHTHSHLDYSKTPTEEYVADCDTGRAWLTRFLGERKRTLRFFRFPMLREGDTLPKVERMRQWLAANGLRNVPVTIDGQDWSFEAPWVAARVAGDTQRLEGLGSDYQTSLRLEALTYTSDGDELLERKTPQVLLLHANEVGAAQWDTLFTWMKGEGFRFVPVDEALEDPAIASLPRFASRFGGSHWYRIRHERREARAEEQVRALLARQADAWSQGDLDGFCSAYVDDVVFVSPSGVTRGRQAVLDRYKTRYPDRAAMGTSAPRGPGGSSHLGARGEHAGGCPAGRHPRGERRRPLEHRTHRRHERQWFDPPGPGARR